MKEEDRIEKACGTAGEHRNDATLNSGNDTANSTACERRHCDRWWRNSRTLVTGESDRADAPAAPDAVRREGARSILIPDGHLLSIHYWAGKVTGADGVIAPEVRECVATQWAAMRHDGFFWGQKQRQRAAPDSDTGTCPSSRRFSGQTRWSLHRRGFSNCHCTLPGDEHNEH